MIGVGVIDILIAVKLLRVKERFTELIRVYAYITMIAGILEVSVLLSPLALILVPVSSILVGMIFLRDQEGVEFV
jgi:hypothetical protein